MAWGRGQRNRQGCEGAYHRYMGRHNINMEKIVLSGTVSSATWRSMPNLRVGTGAEFRGCPGLVRKDCAQVDLV